MHHEFPLPSIDDAALKKFCVEHDLHEAIAAGYHYAQKFFPTERTRISRMDGWAMSRHAIRSFRKSVLSDAIEFVLRRIL